MVVFVAYLFWEKNPSLLKLRFFEVYFFAMPTGTLAYLDHQLILQATASLTSSHTVELYDFGTAGDGSFYYVMEYLDGLDLDTLVERHGPVPIERAVYLLAQACESLADAHEHNLIHRDIKPSNIFATRQGITHDFVKVLDFGLVKDTEPEPPCGPPRAPCVDKGRGVRGSVSDVVGSRDVTVLLDTPRISL